VPEFENTSRTDPAPNHYEGGREPRAFPLRRRGGKAHPLPELGRIERPNRRLGRERRERSHEPPHRGRAGSLLGAEPCSANESRGCGVGQPPEKPPDPESMSRNREAAKTCESRTAGRSGDPWGCKRGVRSHVGTVEPCKLYLVPPPLRSRRPHAGRLSRCSHSHRVRAPGEAGKTPSRSTK
jgi:hypothetical protein